MKKICLYFLLLISIVQFSCSDKPTRDYITRKLLSTYVCKENAKVNGLNILRTEETKSTGGPHIFRYTVSGEIEWPNGCKERQGSTPPGTKEKFNRLLTLYKSGNGEWE